MNASLVDIVMQNVSSNLAIATASVDGLSHCKPPKGVETPVMRPSSALSLLTMTTASRRLTSISRRQVTYAMRDGSERSPPETMPLGLNANCRIAVRFA